MAKKDILRVGVTGAKGRVGRLLVSELRSGAWARLSLGLAGTRETSAEEICAGSDVVIDFTAPESTAKLAWVAAKHHRPLVIGTTGLNDVQMQELQDAAKECPLLYAANMSVGVSLLARLVEQAAKALPDWDIAIAETHHVHKKDSPSGTALALGRASGREGIQYAVQRGGDVVGDHAVTFFGAGERVTLEHIATDRAIFARGALRAAEWLVEQPAGLYGMADVLGLSY